MDRVEYGVAIREPNHSRQEQQGYVQRQFPDGESHRDLPGKERSLPPLQA
jgi:hypothetical protein